MSTDNFTNLMIDIINEDVHFNADIFIIPNSANLIEHFMSKHTQEELTERMNHLCELNGTTFDPKNDYIIQVWYVVKDLDCDNMADHGIRWNDNDNGRHFLRTLSYGSFIPAKLFEGSIEGDVRLIKLPMIHTYRKKEVKQERERVASIAMQCSQRKYRYSSFGNWGDVMKTVIDAGKRI